jgi:hypothetical protein
LIRQKIRRHLELLHSSNHQPPCIQDLIKFTLYLLSSRSLNYIPAELQRGSHSPVAEQNVGDCTYHCISKTRMYADGLQRLYHVEWVFHEKVFAVCMYVCTYIWRTRHWMRHLLEDGWQEKDGGLETLPLRFHEGAASVSPDCSNSGYRTMPARHLLWAALRAVSLDVSFRIKPAQARIGHAMYVHTYICSCSMPACPIYEHMAAATGYKWKRVDMACWPGWFSRQSAYHISTRPLEQHDRVA